MRRKKTIDAIARKLKQEGSRVRIRAITRLPYVIVRTGAVFWTGKQDDEWAGRGFNTFGFLVNLADTTASLDFGITAPRRLCSLDLNGVRWRDFQRGRDDLLTSSGISRGVQEKRKAFLLPSCAYLLAYGMSCLGEVLEMVQGPAASAFNRVDARPVGRYSIPPRSFARTRSGTEGEYGRRDGFFWSQLNLIPDYPARLCRTENRRGLMRYHEQKDN